MCGLAGFIGVKPTHQEVHILSCWNQTRGTDSYGVFNGKQTLKWLSAYSLQINPLNKIEFNDKITLIHCRAKSVGKICYDTCHPIISEDKTRVLIHNGTIKIKDNPYESDSMYLCNKYNEFDFNTYNGTIAMLCYDLRNKTVEVYHGFSDNKEERPLYVGKLRGGIVFSSIELSLISIGCTHVKEVKTNIIYKYNTKGKIIGHRKIDRKPKSLYEINCGGLYSGTLYGRGYGYYDDDYDYDVNYGYSGYTGSALRKITKDPFSAIVFDKDLLCYTMSGHPFTGILNVLIDGKNHKIQMTKGKYKDLIPFKIDNEVMDVFSFSNNVYSTLVASKRTSSLSEDDLAINKIIQDVNKK